MRTSSLRIAALAVLAASFPAAARAAVPQDPAGETFRASSGLEFQVPQAAVAPVHLAFGHSFATWRAYVLSPLFQRLGLRCLTPGRGTQQFFQPPSDCSFTMTNPLAAYSPSNLGVVEINVVFHILQSTSGQGNVTNQQVMNQIDILNEDYRALAGTPGAPGVDTKIRFKLATLTPTGAPTTGITRTVNNSYYNDMGGYWNALAWDPNRYLNVYTNTASGALGYVPFFPQQGGVGTAEDRVVVLWSCVGRNAPIGPPYNQGRSLTHEVGHYLGLFHTFEGGCGGPSCNLSGDLICDTNAESGPRFGCAVGASSCGSLDPVRNYLDYSDDTCMNHFTQEQARRMRCTLQFYRPNIAVPAAPTLGANYCTAASNSTGVPGLMLATGSKSVAANNLAFTATQLPPNTFGYFITSQTQAFVPNAGGSSGNLCVGAPTGRYVANVANSGVFGQIGLVVDLTSVPQPLGAVSVTPGQTWNWQCWFRDSTLGFPTSNFTDGYTITFE